MKNILNTYIFLSAIFVITACGRGEEPEQAFFNQSLQAVGKTKEAKMQPSHKNALDSLYNHDGMTTLNEKGKEVYYPINYGKSFQSLGEFLQNIAWSADSKSAGHKREGIFDLSERSECMGRYLPEIDGHQIASGDAEVKYLKTLSSKEGQKKIEEGRFEMTMDWAFDFDDCRTEDHDVQPLLLKMPYPQYPSIDYEENNRLYEEMLNEYEQKLEEYYFLKDSRLLEVTHKRTGTLKGSSKALVVAEADYLLRKSYLQFDWDEEKNVFGKSLEHIKGEINLESTFEGEVSLLGHDPETNELVPHTLKTKDLIVGVKMSVADYRDLINIINVDILPKNERIEIVREILQNSLLCSGSIALDKSTYSCASVLQVYIEEFIDASFDLNDDA